MRDIKIARLLERGSAYAHSNPIAERIWRRWQGLDDANAALLQWYAVPALVPNDCWPDPLPPEVEAKALSMKTWRRDVIAVRLADMTRRARQLTERGDVLRFAAAYMLDSVGMVGVAEIAPPAQRKALAKPVAQFDFLRQLGDPIEGRAFGVIVGTGPEPNRITIGTVTEADPIAFEALPTYYVGPATEADSVALLHI